MQLHPTTSQDTAPKHRFSAPHFHSIRHRQSTFRCTSTIHITRQPPCLIQLLTTIDTGDEFSRSFPQKPHESRPSDLRCFDVDYLAREIERKASRLTENLAIIETGYGGLPIPLQRYRWEDRRVIYGVSISTDRAIALMEHTSPSDE